MWGHPTPYACCSNLATLVLVGVPRVTKHGVEYLNTKVLRGTNSDDDGAYHCFTLYNVKDEPMARPSQSAVKVRPDVTYGGKENSAGMVEASKATVHRPDSKTTASRALQALVVDAYTPIAHRVRKHNNGRRGRGNLQPPTRTGARVKVFHRTTRAGRQALRQTQMSASGS